MSLDRIKAGHFADALVFGPFAIYTARTVRHRYFKAALIAAGVGTTLYGLWNLLSPQSDQNLDPAAPPIPTLGSARGLRGQSSRHKFPTFGKSVPPLRAYSVNSPANARARPMLRAGSLRERRLRALSERQKSAPR